MLHTTHPLESGIYHRFVVDEGTVWVLVEPIGEGAASLAVYEMAAALAHLNRTDEDAQRLPEVEAARNKFGTGLMLRILREVRDSMPEVKVWEWERKSGANIGRHAVRSV